ncbi:phage portal protein family protein, partial [Pseudomonas aeruginosa]
WLTEWNFPGAQPPRVYRVIEEPEDITAKAERDEKVFRMSGFRPTRGYVQETYGVEVESTQAEATAPTPSTEFAEGDQPSDPAAAMAPQLAEAMQPVVGNWTTQLRTLIEQASSLEDLRERLLDLAPQLSLDQYAQAMAEGLEAAHLAGRNDVQEELDGREQI